MFLEPVLGEGGYLPGSRATSSAGVVDLCRDHGILFVADEVQSGFCRTGRFFAVEHHGVDPDIIVMAKGIASGFPISAIGASAELMSPLARRLPRRDVRREPDRLRRGARHHRGDARSPASSTTSNARGDQLREGLRELAATHPVIRDVRGPGPDGGRRAVRPGARASRRLVASPRSRPTAVSEGRLLLMNAGTYGNVLRWMPPLVVTEDEISIALRCVSPQPSTLPSESPGWPGETT